MRTCLVTLGLLTLGRHTVAQVRPPAASWVEVGGYYHRVSSDFGDWKGGYVRAVLVGARNVWYLDARRQEVFGDRGLYGSLANVHSFSSRFFTQVGLGGGTGDFFFPDLRLDGSLNLKLGRARSVIWTAGGTYVKSKSIYRDQALLGSLTVYGGGVLQLAAGGRVNWSDPDAVRSARAEAALTLGRFGTTLVTLRGGAGTEGYQLTGAAATLHRFRSQEAGATWRAWLYRGLGTVLGAEWYHNPFYHRAGVTVGVFGAW